MKSARSQCSDAFQNAAMRISKKYRVRIAVGSVHVERRIERGDGTDTLDCSVSVSEGGSSQSDRWTAEWRPGEAVTLLSVTLLGAELVDEVVKGTQ
ncbi:hypothetical protein [Paraburkholderia unamae]|uniref:hypothetical protein n=1 Tax=Paraburkholderia unamae TaxID=219649 RepID=UPI001058026C|nr:hypothetical protein [Paraburkholderia unamae]